MMMQYFKTALQTSVFFLLVTSAVYSQPRDIKFEHISLQEGLSQSTIRCIFQDSKGFMWFGTEEGLNKYDGYRFTVYKADAENPNSLSARNVRSICEDRSGALWIGTGSGGVNKFDRATETFTQYQHDAENPNSLSHNTVWAILVDRSGTLWAGTEAGLNKFDREKRQWAHYKHEPGNTNSLSHDRVWSIYEAPTEPSVLWIATAGGLSRLSWNDRNRATFTNYRHQRGNPNSLSNNSVWTIYEDRAGALWVGTYYGLNKFDREKEQWTRFKHEPGNANSLVHNVVRAVCEDQSSALWIGTNGGLSRLIRDNRGNEQFTNYRHELQNTNSLSDNSVISIFSDRSGALWVGTFGCGINKLNPGRKEFSHYKTEPENPNSLSHNFVRAIYEDKAGRLWIGTWGGGLNRLDRNSGEWTHYQREPGNPNSLSDDTVVSIYEDASGMLWVGTFNRGLNKFDRRTNRWTHYNYQYRSENPRNLGVASIFEDRTGVLWLGTGSGLCRMNPRERYSVDLAFADDFTHYVHEPANPNSLSGSSVTVIYEDADGPDGVLWLGTTVGLNRFDRESGIFTHYKNEPGNPNSLSHNDVRVLYEDHAGIFWLGTSGGLTKFDRETEQFTRYTEDEGLPGNVVNGILEDDNGNLWVSTNSRLAKFNPKTEKFRIYDVSDGLQSNEFNGGAFYKSRSGEMFFGGVNGFNSFYPEKITDNPHAPQVAITDFQLANKSVPTGTSLLQYSISETSEIALSYRDRVFSFEFAALHYANPTKNKYAYKMEGLDEEWNYIGRRRFAMFTNLSPGEYTFRVKGSNSDGVWNEAGTSIKISITPPPWKTWWAYSLYLISLGAIIFGFFRFATNRALLKSKLELEHRHAEKLEELDRIKSRFFANISHEFRTPLTLILGPLEKLLAETYDNKLKKQFRLMQRNGQRLLLLINQLLDLSKMEAGSMSLKARPENIVQLIKNTVLFFSSMAERKQIDLRFNSSQEKIIAYVDRDKLEKIVSNLLSNAFKFTAKGGEVAVAVSSGRGAGEKGRRGERENIIEISSAPLHPSSLVPFVEIQVIDSGIGIPPDRLDKIFNRFYQVTEGSATSGRVYPAGQEGTGIGLALAKELVELHRGDITVESPPPDTKTGQGTVFTVRLPLGMAHLNPDEIIAPLQEISLKEKKSRIEPLESIETPEEKSIPESHKDGEIILIVEDNPDIREYVRDFLEVTYQVVEACDGVKGFEIAAEKIPDMIISDVMMPKMDGLELCCKIKTDERTSHIPVILLTARASGDNKLAGLEIGADDYLTKPFDARELLVRIKNLIDQRRRLRERFSREITVQPKDIAITSMDEEFLQRAMAIVEKNISDPEFTTETFAWEIGLSRNQLNLKLRALTDQPTHGFIRMMRLKRAAQLLQQGAGTVSEIVYDVGFNNLSHFAKAFRQQFGQSPSEFAASHSKDI